VEIVIATIDEIIRWLTFKKHYELRTNYTNDAVDSLRLNVRNFNLFNWAKMTQH
jgi:hypothetical protein